MIQCSDKIRNREQKIIVNYTQGHPRCKTCIHKENSALSLQFVCALNKFTIQLSGVCDLWENKKGETLER